MIELSSSLYAAVEEANFLLHHVWIHVLKSKYHPVVKQFTMRPDQIEYEPNDLIGLTDEEQKAYCENFEAMSKEEQKTRSNRQTRSVHFTVLALETSDPSSPNPYQLLFSVNLGSPDSLQWNAWSITSVIITNAITGDKVILPSDSRPAVTDCMNDRYYTIGEKHSRYENAVHFYA